MFIKQIIIIIMEKTKLSNFSLRGKFNPENPVVFHVFSIIKRVIYFIERCMNKEFIEYHQFPFSTLDIRLKDEDAKELYEVCKMLEAVGHQYRVTDGIALGLYRDGHFIRHDNDLDFDLLDVNDTKEIKSVMSKRGYKVGREAYYKGVLQQIVFYNKDHVIVDYVVWHTVDNNKIVNYEEKGYVRKQDAKYFLTHTDFDCYGYTFKLPGYIEKWFVDRYGEDWRIPKTYKGDWKDECPDLAKL